MASILHPLRDDDATLGRRVAAGDATAFAALDARHRPVLMRYAGTLLRRGEHDAEDVVQDVLIRAHDALRSGDGPVELRPWLFRLTRNRAIDEVRRARWGEAALDDALAFSSDRREEPEVVLRRKEAVRQLVEDLAALPVRQRAALLARELDGQTPEQVAGELGVTVMAAHKLASRARENLVKARDARDADCPQIRAALLDSHERGVRPSEHGVRHIRGCDACRAYQRDVRRLSAQLHALHPALGLPLVAGVGQLLGGKAAAGAAAAVLLAATGGVVVLRSDVHSPGEPAPFTMLSIRDSQGRPVAKGRPIPQGLTVVSARVRFPPGPDSTHKGPQPRLTLTCPPGMRYAGLAAAPENPDLTTLVNPVRGAIVGISRSVRMRLWRDASPQPYEYTVAMHCRRPDANGSISPDHNAAFRRALGAHGQHLRHICHVRYSAGIARTPGVRSFGNFERGQPVAAGRRTRAGTWTHVITDGRLPITGWMQTAKLCP
jgi:RNA polymerase sigma factor (sigma-70 family)